MLHASGVLTVHKVAVEKCHSRSAPRAYVQFDWHIPQSCRMALAPGTPDDALPPSSNAVVGTVMQAVQGRSSCNLASKIGFWVHAEH